MTPFFLSRACVCVCSLYLSWSAVLLAPSSHCHGISCSDDSPSRRPRARHRVTLATNLFCLSRTYLAVRLRCGRGMVPDQRNMWRCAPLATREKVHLLRFAPTTLYIGTIQPLLHLHVPFAMQSMKEKKAAAQQVAVAVGVPFPSPRNSQTHTGTNYPSCGPVISLICDQASWAGDWSRAAAHTVS